MRIVLLSGYAFPHVGGVEAVVDSMARELRRRGHEVRCVTSSATHATPATTALHDRANGIVRVPAWNAAEDRAGVPWPLFSPTLASTLRGELRGADVVHGHGMLYLSVVAGLTMARRTGAVRVLTEHVGHVAYDSPAVDRVQALAIGSVGRAAARAAQGIVVLNEGVEATMRHLAPRATVERIPNGIDAETFSPATGAERAALRARRGWDGRPRVVFVGRMVAKKGLDIALAAAAASTGAFDLVLVGPGDVPADLPPNVTALGMVPPDQLPDLYRAADAFVLPSRGEGFPVTVQEAMASGLPVVLSDDPNYAPYLVGSGAGATLVTAEGIAVGAALRGLVEDPGRLAAAGREAREHAVRSFSWERAIDQHLDLYAELAAR